jgi:hypothetical protein
MTIILSLLLAAQPAAAAAPPSAPATSAPAPDWRPLRETRGLQIAWDAASVERGDTLFVRIRVTPPRPGDTYYAYAITRMELRCAPSEGHAIRTVNYFADGTSGRTDESPVPFVPIFADSPFALLHNALCPDAPPSPAAPLSRPAAPPH